MEHGDVIEMLDTLYSMIAEAWGVPLGNDKCIIEREKALDIINEIKATMPSSLAEANRLVAARDAVRMGVSVPVSDAAAWIYFPRQAAKHSAAWPNCRAAAADPYPFVPRARHYQRSLLYRRSGTAF